MGQSLGCGERHEHPFFTSVKDGDSAAVRTMIDEDPTLMDRVTVHGGLSPLHFAAANGQIEVLSMILDRVSDPDFFNQHKQTPLMLAAIHGEISCVDKLIQAGANILKFDSVHGRTCLHYAAHHGHSDCLQAILSAAHSTPVASSWGFTRFVNIRDGTGATPLHLAARQGHLGCVRILLDQGALICASTGGFGHLGNTALHFAARGGSLDCVRELLARGADRLQIDASGKVPYMVALKHKHESCAALLNPSSPEPLVWPASLKLIDDLDSKAKKLLERTLIEVNKEREKTVLKETATASHPSPLHSDSGHVDDVSEGSEMEQCCICFEQVSTIEVQKCSHRMCAYCTLALFCHNKPSATTPCAKSPVCPFCRSRITQLVAVELKQNEPINSEFCTPKPRKSSRLSSSLNEESSSFKGLSFGKSVRDCSGKVGAECNGGV